MQQLKDTLIARLLLIGTVTILVLIPFHALLTVWLASLGANYTAVRLWKELLLVVLVAGLGILAIRAPELRQSLWRHKKVRLLATLIGLYVAYHLLSGGIAYLRGDVSAMALGYALISNLRYLVFFVLAGVVGYVYRDWLAKYWKHIVLLPALLVVLFGLTQEYLLPYDVLKHVGYGVDTIAPYIAVDNKVEYARLQSTMRGPNPLGAYLVIVLSALAVLFLARTKGYARIGLMILATLIVLYGTYSRSAWIGVAAALAVVFWGVLHSPRLRKILIVIMAAGLIVGAGGVYVLRDHDTVQNVLFHTDENSGSSRSSNEDRANALLSGVRDTVTEPLGRGPGTAGPASVYNEAGPSRVSENYFLQLGQEIGVIGLGLFLAINILVGLALWRIGGLNNPLALALVASLAGLTMVNMLSHAWADDTLAYVWWGLAGLAIGSNGVKRRERL